MGTIPRSTRSLPLPVPYQTGIAMKWDSELYNQKHAFVFKYGEDLLALLDVESGERIPDVGCGAGQLTAQIAAAGADVACGDPLDVLCSNAGLHWVGRAEAGVIRMSRAPKPGGRFVVECGGKGSLANIASALEQAAREVRQVEVRATNYFPCIGQYT